MARADAAPGRHRRPARRGRRRGGRRRRGAPRSPGSSPPSRGPAATTATGSASTWSGCSSCSRPTTRGSDRPPSAGPRPVLSPGRAGGGVGYRGRSCPIRPAPRGRPRARVRRGRVRHRVAALLVLARVAGASRCTSPSRRPRRPAAARRTCTSCTPTSTPSGRPPSRCTHGGDIYDTPAKLRNLNPPLLAALLAPFALLDALTGLPPLRRADADHGGRRGRRGGPGAAAAPPGRRRRVVLVVLASSPLHGTLLLGQIYPLLLVGLVAGWIAERRGRPLLAAALLRRHRGAQAVARAVAAAPAVQRRWRPAAGGVRRRGRGDAARRAGRRPVERAAVAADRPRRARARHRGQRLAARPGRPARAAVGGGHACSAWPCWSARWSVLYRHRGQVDPAGTAPWAVLAAGLLMSPIAWHNYLMLLWPGVLLLLARGGPGRTGPDARRCCWPSPWCRCRGTRCGRPESGGRSPAGPSTASCCSPTGGCCSPGRPGRRRPAGLPTAPRGGTNRRRPRRSR